MGSDCVNDDGGDDDATVTLEDDDDDEASSSSSSSRMATFFLFFCCCRRGRRRDYGGGYATTEGRDGRHTSVGGDRIFSRFRQILDHLISRRKFDSKFNLKRLKLRPQEEEDCRLLTCNERTHMSILYCSTTFFSTCHSNIKPPKATATRVDNYLTNGL